MIVVAFATLFTVFQLALCSCPEGFEPVRSVDRNMCYHFINGEFSHSAAEYWCEKCGAELFRPQSKEALFAMASKARRVHKSWVHLWLGYSRQDGQFVDSEGGVIPDVWLMGNPSIYREEGADCVMVYSSSDPRGASNHKCSELAYAVCQRPALD